VRGRTFSLFWLGGTLGVLTYAGLDLVLHPHLQTEMGLSMTPNWEKLPDLAHWGGRLLHHGMTPLLAANAVILGGLIALVASVIVSRFQRRREVERFGVFEDAPPSLRSRRGDEIELDLTELGTTAERPHRSCPGP
jgi:hypothetical protein